MRKSTLVFVFVFNAFAASGQFLPFVLRRLTNARRHCVCSLSYTPVCANNGRVYANACEAACVGVVSERNPFTMDRSII